LPISQGWRFGRYLSDSDLRLASLSNFFAVPSVVKQQFDDLFDTMRG
jgi:hypothetical protein